MSIPPDNAAATGRKKLAQGEERSDDALGRESQNTPSRVGAKEDGMVALGEMTEIRVAQDGPPSRGEFTYVDISSIDRETKRIVDPKCLPVAKAPSRAKQVLKAGDVLVSMTRPNLNAVALVPPDLDGAIGSTGFHVLRAKNAEPGFLFYAVQTTSFVDAMCQKVQGALYPAVRPKDISSFSIHPFALAQQRLIVAEIEKQFTRLEAGVAALRRVQANLKRYRAAVLKAACEGKLFLPEAQWQMRQISDVIATMDQGWSPKCESDPSPDDDTWAVIKTTAIQNLRFDQVENKKLPVALKPRPHLELQPGDLLITRAGPRARVGVACLVRQTRPRLMLCDKVYRLRCKSKVMNPAFLELILNAPHIVDALNDLKTGISDSGVNLTQKRFGELATPLPPLAEQTQIVAEVERRLSVVEELESVVSANLQWASRLRQSILQHAFRGKITISNQKQP